MGRHPVARPHGGCKDCVAPRGAPLGDTDRCANGKRSPARSLLPLGGGAWCGAAHAAYMAAARPASMLVPFARSGVIPAGANGTAIEIKLGRKPIKLIPLRDY